MSITSTSTLESAGSLTDAAAHRSLLLALDELLEARFNGRSWRIFTSEPQLQAGDEFLFGTSTNISTSATAYDSSAELPDPPEPEQVLDYDASTKVVHVDGTFDDTRTLNRRYVMWQSPEETEPSKWWLQFVRAERWEPLGLADIFVEDYEDPVASDNETFTWRSHWDRYGTIRIHNGNRFALTLEFEGAEQSSVEIPPYGIICGRRTNYDQPFLWETTYLPLTRSDDPLKWESQYLGQPAAAMEQAANIFDGLETFCRFVGGPDLDTTSREMGSFTGAPIQSTDLTQDWLCHRGKLLSVVLDKRDGTVTTTELQYDGVATISGGGWPGHVTTDIPFPGFFRFTSDATAPAGATDEEWEHDLIPISTNCTRNQVLALRAGPESVQVIPQGLTPLWRRNLEYGEFASGSTDFYSPHASISAYSLKTLSGTAGSVQGPTTDATETIADAFPVASIAGDFTRTQDKICKSGSALVHVEDVVLDEDTLGLCEFTGSPSLLDAVDTTGEHLAWHAVSSGGLTNPDSVESRVGRRFTPRQVRKYHEAGELDGGFATYISHPQDTDVDGTADGMGGALGWSVLPILSSQVAIQGTLWQATDTTKGRVIYAPVDTIHAALEHLEEENWWLDNREDVIAGTLAEEDKLISWRVPRLVEHFNDLARAINSVQEVFQASIRDLFKDPLPANLSPETENYPFSQTDTPWAVPYGWVTGRYDSGNVLSDWATAWGISLEEGVPNVADLRTTPRAVFYTARPDSMVDPDADEKADIRLGDAENNTEISYDEDTENSETYNTHSAWSAASQRAIFGGAGTDSGYKWLSESAALAVFDSLGVPLPPLPVGERFTPTIATPTSITQIAGPTRPGGEVERFDHDAFVPFRDPDDDGDWLRVINGPFRLIEPSGVPRRIYIFAGEDNGGTHIWQVTESGNSQSHLPYYHDLTSAEIDQTLTSASNYGLTPRSTSATGPEFWPTLTRIDSPYPILLVASPEPWWGISYVSPPPISGGSGGDDHIDREAHDPDPDEGFFWRECALSDMPITVAKIKEWSDTDWDAWHCQTVVRSGVLRA